MNTRLLAVCALGLGLHAARAQTNFLFISGNVMTGKTWHAAQSRGNGGSGSCSPTTGLVQYYSAPFFTDTSATTYSLQLYYESFQSGFVYLYQDGFDPRDPCRGIVEFGFAPLANIYNIKLDANRQYVFVTSEAVLYGGGGSFQVSIRGPVGSHIFRGSLTPMSSAVGSISLASGGAQPWSIDAGAAHAGELYLVLGSISGTTPGTPIPGGRTLPLNWDGWLAFTLSGPNVPPLFESFGLLDGDGRTSARGLVLPAASPPALAGLVVHHAFVALDAASGVPTFVSNALALQLVQ